MTTNAGYLPMTRLLLTSLLMVSALSWVFSLPIRAAHEDLIVSRAYLADPDGREDIGSVARRHFTPFSGPLFHGNDARPLWLRLTLAPSADPDWVVTYLPGFTHEVETWMPDPAGGWRRAVTGSRFAFSRREVATLAPAVAVRPAPDRQLTIYARVLTPTTPIHAQVIRRADAMAFDALVSLVSGVFIGVGLLMALLALMIHVSTRERLWALDAAFNLLGVFLLTIQMGLLSRLIWPDSEQVLNRLTLVSNCLYTVGATTMYLALFPLFGLRQRQLWPHWTALAIQPFLLLLILRDRGDLAMSLNNLAVLVMSIWGVFVVWRARHADRAILNTFRIAYGGVLLYTLVWGVAVVLHVQTGSLAALYPNMPAGLFSELMLMLVLSRLTQYRLAAARQLAREKDEAERRLRFERERHEDTSSFLGMLMHEIRNPLSTIRMTAANLAETLPDTDDLVRRRWQRLHQSVDVIDEVLERGVEVDSLEQGALTLEIGPADVAALLRGVLAELDDAGRCRVDLPAALVARVDDHLVRLMMRNLVDNALKYSPAHSAIGIVLVQEAAVWRLIVRNAAGPAGFPEPGRIFSKYYRAPGASHRGGMGLGLYWLHGVAARMGGSVSYRREQEQVVFTLCLPI